MIPHRMPSAIEATPASAECSWIVSAIWAMVSGAGALRVYANVPREARLSVGHACHMWHHPDPYRWNIVHVASASHAAEQSRKLCPPPPSVNCDVRMFPAPFLSHISFGTYVKSSRDGICAPPTRSKNCDPSVASTRASHVLVNMWQNPLLAYHTKYPQARIPSHPSMHSWSVHPRPPRLRKAFWFLSHRSCSEIMRYWSFE
mmetsp:Transcript_8461/g.21659  ORF Transcript_8461/g.21659 Transcript_8461/m.21659 type:complete len:202 (-) Transcript_8461:1464-2069(-)